MSGHVPILKPRELVRALEKDGWYSHCQKGSHMVLHKTGSRNLIVVPMHDRDVPLGTLRCILSDAGLNAEDLTALLEQ